MNIPKAEVFTAELKIKKKGELRYGKGKISVTESEIHLTYKKFLGLEKEIMHKRSELKFAEYSTKVLPIRTSEGNLKATIVTLIIGFDDGDVYIIYVGQSGQGLNDYYDKIETLYEFLNSDDKIKSMYIEKTLSESAYEKIIQRDLACPKCGNVGEYLWVCPKCQSKQPYYFKDKIVQFCSHCGFDRRPFLPDPAILCSKCQEYSEFESWIPVPKN